MKDCFRAKSRRKKGIHNTSRICLGVILSMREPVFCSSTVVSGSGFLEEVLSVVYQASVELDTPFLDVLVRDFGYPCLRPLQDHLV